MVFVVNAVVRMLALTSAQSLDACAALASARTAAAIENLSIEWTLDLSWVLSWVVIRAFIAWSPWVDLIHAMVGGAALRHNGMRGQFTGFMMPTALRRAASITKQHLN
jgi:hypothetical protein